MADKLEIINRALIRIGEPPGATLGDSTKAMTTALKFYDSSAKEIIRGAPWTCSIKRAVLSKPATKKAWVASTAFALNDYVITSAGYVYKVTTGGDSGTSEPSSFATTPFTNGTMYISFQHQIEFPYIYSLPTDCVRVLKLFDDAEYVVEGKELQTAADPAVAVYLWYDGSATPTVETYWDDNLAQAIELRLASKISFAMMARMEMGQTMLQEAVAMTIEARQNSIFERKDRSKGGVDWWTDIS